jgi:predicted O-methyltransferase YrrM
MNLIRTKIKRAVETIRDFGFHELVKKALPYIFFTKDYIFENTIARFYLYPKLLPKIRNFKQNSSLEEIIDFTFSSSFKLITPIQIRSEIFELLIFIKQRNPKYILELGTARGGTLYLFSNIASQDACIISVDLPYGFSKIGYSIWRKQLYKSFEKANQKIYLVLENSHEHRCLETVKSILNGNMLDLLFIDGDHTYEGVKKDFEIFSPLVRDSGVILFHDIVEFPKNNLCKVSNFWNEIKHKYEYMEFVEDWHQGSAGLGLIIKKS